mmetsp:Transcript_5198/g.16490  ORF Transcript_5198/g.16490 Transcript_5198/m.16490 type:complete len:204 (-) Transcript_5198:17-628(-)
MAKRNMAIARTALSRHPLLEPRKVRRLGLGRVEPREADERDLPHRGKVHLQEVARQQRLPAALGRRAEVVHRLRRDDGVVVESVEHTVRPRVAHFVVRPEGRDVEFERLPWDGGHGDVGAVEAAALGPADKGAEGRAVLIESEDDRDVVADGPGERQARDRRGRVRRCGRRRRVAERGASRDAEQREQRQRQRTEAAHRGGCQ